MCRLSVVKPWHSRAKVAPFESNKGYDEVTVFSCKSIASVCVVGNLFGYFFGLRWFNAFHGVNEWPVVVATATTA